MFVPSREAKEKKLNSKGTFPIPFPFPFPSPPFHDSQSPHLLPVFCHGYGNISHSLHSHLHPRFPEYSAEGSGCEWREKRKDHPSKRVETEDEDGGREGGRGMAAWHRLEMVEKQRGQKNRGKKQRWQNGGMNYGMEWTRKKTTG
jgi:hypothetical protein